MQELPIRSGTADAFILVKAAPNPTSRAEYVCCAGINDRGEWMRLYPIDFRHLKPEQKFGRWGRISFEWRTPRTDPRIESRRVEQHSIKITGELTKSDRPRLLGKSIVTSVDREREAGRSLALLEAEILDFTFERKPKAEYDAERDRFQEVAKQDDLFETAARAYEPCPYKFRYRYRSDDGERRGTCQDWEIEATFFKWRRLYGEKGALDRMAEKFGGEYRRKGMLFAMGTHSQYPDRWLINGVIRLDPIVQGSLL